MLETGEMVKRLFRQIYEYEDAVVLGGTLFKLWLLEIDWPSAWSGCASPRFSQLSSGRAAGYCCLSSETMDHE